LADSLDYAGWRARGECVLSPSGDTGWRRRVLLDAAGAQSIRTVVLAKADKSYLSFHAAPLRAPPHDVCECVSGREQLVLDSCREPISHCPVSPGLSSRKNCGRGSSEKIGSRQIW